jgi:hypothetical protein
MKSLPNKSEETAWIAMVRSRRLDAVDSDHDEQYGKPQRDRNQKGRRLFFRRRFLWSFSRGSLHIHLRLIDATAEPAQRVKTC